MHRRSKAAGVWPRAATGCPPRSRSESSLRHSARSSCGRVPGAEIGVQERDNRLAQKGAPCHPLKVVAPAMVIRPVETPTKPRHDPAKQRLVIDMHPEGDVRLLAAPPPKCPSPIRMPTRIPSSTPDPSLFHRQVSRETAPVREATKTTGRHSCDRRTTVRLGASSVDRLSTLVHRTMPAPFQPLGAIATPRHVRARLHGTLQPSLMLRFLSTSTAFRV